ncbi:MAG: hypothetical protein ACJARX_001020 [Psychroserpens sp.]|jgi:hypothetical protein
MNHKKKANCLVRFFFVIRVSPIKNGVTVLITHAKHDLQSQPMQLLSSLLHTLDVRVTF